MASVNKVILVGNLGKDPEARFLPSGKPVTNVNIATSNKKDGQEYTQWHRCVAYEKNAEVLGQHGRKGQTLYIEGSIRYGKFTNKDGVEQHTTDIIIHAFQFVSSKREEQQEPRPQQEQRSQEAGFDSDEIPF